MNYKSDDTCLPGKSITEDLDPEFFKIISGRPIKNKKSISQYLEEIRACFLINLKKGFILDEILLADESYIAEKNHLKEIRNSMLLTQKSFEDFLKSDHSSSRKILVAVSEEIEKNFKKCEIISDLSKTLRETEMEILRLDEEWRNSRMFQEFLKLIAPLDWKKTSKLKYKKWDFKGSVSDPCLFNRFRQNSDESPLDLEPKIAQTTKDKKEWEPYELQFANAQQIHEIIDEFERENLRAVSHCDSLELPRAKASTVMEKMRIAFKQSEEKFKEDIQFYKLMVEAEERKAALSEKLFRKIFAGLFFKLITRKKHLSAISLLEDAYETVFGASDSDLSPLTMIKELELECEKVLLALDNVPNSLMVETTKAFYKDQKIEMAEAVEAEKKVQRMESMFKRLSRAFQTANKTTKLRKIASRSLPPKEQWTQAKQPKIFTHEQKERKFLFERTGSKTGSLHRPLCL